MKTNLHYPKGAQTSVRFTFLMRSGCGLKSALLATALALFTHTTFAQTWQTVDDFQYVLGHHSWNVGLAVTPNGSLFASGYALDSAGIYHALVVVSADAGANWSGAIDDYLYGPDYDTLYDGGMAADSQGNLYVAGETYYVGSSPTNNDLANHWIVRRSMDGGLTWSLVDDFEPGSYETHPVGITVDRAGNVYVVGMAAQSGAGEVWTVRKGSSGTSFATVDIYSGPYGSQSEGIYADPTGAIFAVGSAPIPGTKNNSWIVRRSRDGGATWAIVDTFQLTRNWSSRAFGVGADALGNIYVVGQGNVTGKANTLYGHWVVRKSSDGGTSWSTVDNYQLSASAHSAAWRFASDSNGNLYVAGWGQATSSGNHHWIVRKSSGGTSTWTTDDDFQYVPGGATDPQAVVANALGNVFVGGAVSSYFGSHWLVRKK